MKNSPKHIVVVDLGGTKILATVINLNSEIISRLKKSTNPKDKNQSILNRIISTIEDSVTSANLNMDSIEGIVIGVPGSLNPETGIVNLAPNLGWKNFNVVEPLQNHFKKRILIENDANLGTLGIYKYELNSKCKNIIAIFVGTGVGAGLIIDGKLYYGKNYYAGEIGHIKVKEDGYKCGCGNYGCLETEASRTAITRIINEHIKKGEKSVITKLVNDTKVIKSSTLKKAIKLKDKIALKAVNHAAKELGIISGNLINLLNPDYIVFSGGVTEAIGKYMLPIIKENAKKASLKSNFKSTKITISRLKDDSATYGGLALFISKN